MSFSGANFYSYNTVIASIVRGVDAQPVYLLTKKGSYSKTTSTHQGIIEDAIPRMARVFDVPPAGRHNGDVFSDFARIMKGWAIEVDEILESANKAREPKRSRLLGEAQSKVNTMRLFAEAVGLKKVKLPTLPLNVSELFAVMAKREAKTKRDAAKAAKLKAAHDAEQQIIFAQDRLAWLAGTSDSTSWARSFPVELRIEHDEVVTSQGAYFPVVHAQRALTLVDSVMQRGEEWRTNGHTCHLGHYRIDRITPDGTVYAGCHVVTLAAIQRIADEVRSFVPAAEVA